ncbi:Hypothetical protein FKW44_002968 [Caligus rogercresseyi]|uniref:Uncharacterized protein n=1 Tax=Caligus rogercresseyi TaxID=217165 RepID=A0A7T8KKX9_CALRO|nr:Hypothetical protein FKW44_002968 [Caligus rogercresseyi]
MPLDSLLIGKLNPREVIKLERTMESEMVGKDSALLSKSKAWSRPKKFKDPKASPRHVTTSVLHLNGTKEDKNAQMRGGSATIEEWWVSSLSIERNRSRRLQLFLSASLVMRAT